MEVEKKVKHRDVVKLLEALGIDNFTTDLYQRKFILFREEDFKKIISFIGCGDGAGENCILLGSYKIFLNSTKSG
jgi:hypothetical protein